MATVKYTEPEFLKIGKQIYENFAELKSTNKIKGNFVSLVSDAMKQLRQRGPFGLKVWSECDSSNRSFLYDIMKEQDFFVENGTDFDKAWNSIELGIKVLIYAKYVARTTEN